MASLKDGVLRSSLGQTPVAVLVQTKGDAMDGPDGRQQSSRKGQCAGRGKRERETERRTGGLDQE